MRHPWLSASSAFTPDRCYTPSNSLFVRGLRRHTGLSTRPASSDVTGVQRRYYNYDPQEGTDTFDTGMTSNGFTIDRRTMILVAPLLVPQTDNGRSLGGRVDTAVRTHQLLLRYLVMIMRGSRRCCTLRGSLCRGRALGRPTCRSLRPSSGVMVLTIERRVVHAFCLPCTRLCLLDSGGEAEADLCLYSSVACADIDARSATYG